MLNDYPKVAWWDNRPDVGQREWGRASLTPTKLSDFLTDWLDRDNKQHYLYLLKNLFDACDEYQMKYTIERFLYMDTNQVKEFLEWCILCNYKCRLNYKQSWLKRQFAKAICDQIRNRQKCTANTLNECVAMAAIAHRHSWHWCQDRINEEVQKYVQKHPRVCHGRLQPLSNVVTTELIQAMQQTLKQAKAFKSEIKSIYDYNEMMWSKFAVGRIVICPAMVLSVLGVKCTKISKADISLDETYEGSRDGSVVLLDGSIPYPMLQPAEINRALEDNKENGVSNAVFEKLNTEYKEIVC